MARRNRGTKGQHCTRYRLVRVKGQGMAKRCANFAGGKRTKRGGKRRRRR